MKLRKKFIIYLIPLIILWTASYAFSVRWDSGWGDSATTTSSGVVELATDDETVTGTSDVVVTTPGNITAKMAAPGAIGGTTPAAGSFTDLTMTQTFTPFQGADVASANAITLGVGNLFDITGTTTINTIATKGIGTIIVLQFDAILQLTHSADLFLPTAANITTAAGDIAVFQEYASADWRCISYLRADGTPVHATLTSLAGLTETNGGIPYGTADNSYAWLAAGAQGALFMGNGAGAPSWLAAGALTEMLVGAGAADPVWTTATGTGAPVRANSPTLVTPVLGAATATTLTVARSATPGFVFQDSDCTDSDDNAHIYANATATGAGVEVVDIYFRAQGAGGTPGAMDTFMWWDGSAENLTLLSTSVDGMLSHTPSATTASPTLYANDASIVVAFSVVRVSGNAGAVLLDVDPAIADGTIDGQIVYLQGCHDTNTVTIADACNTQLAGAASAVLGLGDILTLLWDDGSSVWMEVSRSDN